MAPGSACRIVALKTYLCLQTFSHGFINLYCPRHSRIKISYLLINIHRITCLKDYNEIL